MAKGLGLVGNLCIYGTGAIVFGYVGWELSVIRSNMLQIDADHVFFKI